MTGIKAAVQRGAFGRSQFGGGGGRRRALIGGKVGKRDVGFMANALRDRKSVV